MALIFALVAPALAQDRRGGSLDRVLPHIRKSVPGTFYDAEGPYFGADGRPTYRIKWMTPDNRIIWFSVDAQSGRVLSGTPSGPAPGRYRNGDDRSGWGNAPRNNWQDNGGWGDRGDRGGQGSGGWGGQGGGQGDRSGQGSWGDRSRSDQSGNDRSGRSGSDRGGNDRGGRDRGGRGGNDRGGDSGRHRPHGG